LLLRGENATALQTGTYVRHDVTEANGNTFNLDNSGFSLNQDISDLGAGRYTVAILLKDEKTGKEGLILTDKTFEK
jgi:hypothetical protein